MLALTLGLCYSTSPGKVRCGKIFCQPQTDRQTDRQTDTHHLICESLLLSFQDEKEQRLQTATEH